MLVYLLDMNRIVVVSISFFTGALTACVGPAVAHHVRTFFDSPIGGDISATPS